MPNITSHRMFISGDFLMDEYTRTTSYDCSPDDIDISEGLSAVDLAVNILSDVIYVEQCSSWPFHVGAWYSRTDEPDQMSPAGATAEENSAHLNGFTPEEEQEIYAKLAEKKLVS